MILVWLYFIIFWIVFAWYNYAFIEHKEFHIIGAFVSVFLAAGFAIMSWLKPYKINDWKKVAMLVFIILSIRWFVFDIALNLMRGLAWNYIGKTSWMDINIGVWSIYIVKPVLLLLSFYFSTLIKKVK